MKILKAIGHVLLFILLFIWQLPQNIVALVMLPFLGKLELISYKKMCWAFKCTKMTGGISLGNFVYLDYTLSNNQASIMHEQEGHTVDSKILGPLYLFIIGIPSIMWAWFGPDYICYYNFYTEKWANKHAGLEVDKYCGLVIKNKEDF
jgi:hypothetical protein